MSGVYIDDRNTLVVILPGNGIVMVFWCFPGNGIRYPYPLVRRNSFQIYGADGKL
jgi:cytosine/uracil/thiamine/allantoin permease